MFSDYTERSWFVFQLPGSPGVKVNAYVPAESEAQARERLRASSYPGAPVEQWPLTGTRFASREALTKSFLRPKDATS